MSNEYESFVELARQDLDASRRLLGDAKHVGRAAFFVSQAAEKLIKAVLKVEGIAFQTTHHQLGALAALLPTDHEWRAELASFDAFTGFATRFRYPTPRGDLPRNPKREEVIASLDQVAAIIDDLLDWCLEAAIRKQASKKP